MPSSTEKENKMKNDPTILSGHYGHIYVGCRGVTAEFLGQGPWSNSWALMEHDRTIVKADWPKGLRAQLEELNKTGKIDGYDYVRGIAVLDRVDALASFKW